MSQGHIPSLGDTNILVDKAGHSEPVPLKPSSYTIYRPKAPDYSGNKRVERSDPQPDRRLPSRGEQVQEAVRNVRSSQREVNIPNSSMLRIIHTHVDSGLGDVIDAISGSVDTGPAPKKPISQRNRIR